MFGGQMRLKYKFAAYIFIFGGLFLFAISALYFIETRIGDIHSQSLFFQKTAEERAEHISIALKEKARVASVLARSPALLSALEASNAGFSAMNKDKRLAEIKRLDELWMKAGDENDEVVRSVMTNTVAEFFREHERALPGEYGEIFLTNKYGVTIAATKKLTTLAHAHKYWWKAAYNNGKGRVFFDDRGYDMSARGYVIGATVPVVKDGAIIGILKCNHDITATLKQVVESYHPGPTGRLVIARAKGKIVLGTGLKPLKSEVSAEFVEKMKGRAPGHLIIGKTGAQTLAAYAPLKIGWEEGEYGFGGTSDSIDHLMGNRGEIWFVVIWQSLAEATAESFERTKEIGLAGLALIGLMGVAAFYFGGRMAAPVARMEAFATKIGEGDYDVELKAGPEDEMGRLASAFNQMAANLRTTTTSRDKLMEEVELRRATEAKLLESEERFRRFAEATFEGIAVSEKGRFLDVNRCLVEMLGYENADEIIGRNVLDLTAPAYRDIVAANIAAGYEKPYEIFGIRKDGAFIPLEVHGRMMDIEGRVLRIAALRDLRERKEAEKKLAASTEVLKRERNIFVGGPVVVFRWRAEEGWPVEYVSPNVMQQFGYGQEDLTSGEIPFAAIVEAADLDRVAAEVEELSRSGASAFEQEYRIHTADGEVKWIHDSTVVERDPNGIITHYVGYVFDITGRKEAEKALLESESKYRALVEETTDWLWELDENGVFTYSSPQVREITGYEAEEILGKNPFDFMRTEEARRVFQFFRDTSATRKPFQAFENTTIHKDGHEIVVETSGAPCFGVDGRFIGYRGINRDVTARKKAEEDARQKANDMRALLDAAEESMFLMEVGGVVIALNETAAKRFGKTPDEMVGRNIYDFMPPELAAVRKEREAEAVRNRSALTVEDERSGRFLRTTLWPVVDSQTGEVIRLAAFSMDMTKSRKREMEMQENRALLRRTLDSLMDAVFVIDAATVTIKEVNKAATDIFGYKADELIGRTTDFLHVSPESLEAFRKELYPAIEKDGYLHLRDFRMRRCDGSIFPTENSVFPLNDEQGRPVAWVSVVRDVSKVVEAEERFRLLFNSGSDAIFVHHVFERGTGKFIEVNDIACQRLGYSREELLNMSPVDIDDAGQPGYAEDMARIAADLKTGNEATFERVHVTKDGRPIPVEISARLFTFRGKPTALSIARDITERKRLEKEIRESGEILERIFETTHFHVVLLDTKFNFIRVNKAYADVCGFPPEHFVGKNHFDMYPSEELESRFRRVVETGVPYTVYGRPFEFPDKPWLGVTYWDLAVYPVKGASGGVEDVLFTLMEVTERKKAEAEIRDAHQRLLTIMDSLDIAICLSDAKSHQLIYANPYFLAAFGIADPRRTTCHMAIHGLSGKCGFCPVEKLIGPDGEPTEGYSWEWRSGSNGRWYASDDRAIRWIDGRIVIIHAAVDITVMKVAEEALAASEKKLRDITSTLGQGVFALDGNGRLTFMNPEAERLLGWTEAELLGKDIHNLIHGRREDGAITPKKECPYHMTLNTGKPHVSDDGIMMRKEGGAFPAHIVATPIIEKGKVAGAVVVFSDITERQRILRDLTEAKNRAEEATALKDKFVSLVAHDLKSPFSSMLGLLELMGEDEKPPLDAKKMDILQNVLESGRRMMWMINELLDISRLKTGKIVPQPRFFSAFTVAEIAVNSVSLQAENKGVKIVNTIPLAARLYGDISLFGEVLGNLLTNAVKFTRNGGVVTVFSPGEGVVAVRDTGVGVSGAFLPYIFRHEEKTTSPGTDGELGTGLGLPLSHDMMAAMGGDLTVESEEGKGSVFYAKLPVVKPKALVVDDEVPIRFIIRQHLELMGVEALEAGDVATALSLAERERPHLILTDIMMPGKGGFELLAALKKNPVTAPIPVIMITADNQVETREKAFRAGADDFLNKPIRSADFVPRVRRFMG